MQPLVWNWKGQKGTAGGAGCSTPSHCSGLVQGRGIAGGSGSGGMGTGTISSGAAGPPVATGSSVRCRLVCTRLPPGGSGGDHRPDGELLGVETMWDLICRFSVGKLSEVFQRSWFSPKCHACLCFDNLLIVRPQPCQRYSVIVLLFSLVWLGE